MGTSLARTILKDAPLTHPRCRLGGVILVALLTFLSTISLSVQQPNYLESAWLSGASTVNQDGSYGQLGDPNTANVPGARWGSAGWYDQSNRELWLFGGFGWAGSTHHLNDLWRYRMNDSTWTWMSGSATSVPGVYGTKGQADPLNCPGSRYGAFNWFDPVNRELWMFGGDSLSGSTVYHFNDLWKYSLSNFTWTWIAGSDLPDQPGVYGQQGISTANTTPGARKSGVSWFDHVGRSLWLFGGAKSHLSMYWNDVWRFDLTDLTWTWVTGSNLTNDAGNMGTMGVADPSNTPGARQVAGYAFDHVNRQLWMYGGDNINATGQFSDLWQFRLNDSMWIWMSGSSLAQPATYNTPMGYSDAVNNPGARFGPLAWFDADNQDFWLFGGGYRISGTLYYKNDLWRYRPSNNMWTWMAGANTLGDVGVYGTKNFSSTTYQPANRNIGLSNLIDSIRREIYLFGGIGSDGGTQMLFRNDLWAFKLPALPLPPTDPPASAPIAAPIAAPTAPPAVAPIFEPPSAAPATRNDSSATLLPPSAENGQAIWGAIVGAAAAAIVVVILIVVALVIFRRKKSSRSQTRKHPMAKMGGATSEPSNDYEAFPSNTNTATITTRTISTSDDLLEGFKPEWMIPHSEIKFSKKLGQGAFGVVYQGIWNGTNVAVKQSTVMCVDDDSIQDLKREALLMLNLRPHPNCIQMLGISVNETNVFVVMELCVGGALEPQLAAGALSLDRKLTIIAGIAAGVRHLHRHGIVHRDIAARNILLGHGDVAKVSDFGMSRIVDQFERQGITNSNVGPIRWMAPEALIQRIYSPKSDVWAWANTVIEILTEKVPYHGLDIAQVIRTVNDYGTAPELHGAECPQWLLELLHLCWSVSPEDRPSMDQISDTILHYVPT